MPGKACMSADDPAGSCLDQMPGCVRYSTRCGWGRCGGRPHERHPPVAAPGVLITRALLRLQLLRTRIQAEAGTSGKGHTPGHPAARPSVPQQRQPLKEAVLKLQSEAQVGYHLCACTVACCQGKAAGRTRLAAYQSAEVPAPRLCGRLA